MPFLEPVRSGASIASSAGQSITGRTHRAIVRIAEGGLIREAEVLADEHVALRMVDAIHTVTSAVMVSTYENAKLREALSSGDPVLAGKLMDVENIAVLSGAEILRALSTSYQRRIR